MLNRRHFTILVFVEQVFFLGASCCSLADFALCKISNFDASENYLSSHRRHYANEQMQSREDGLLGDANELLAQL
jgi:hypothetical protein